MTTSRDREPYDIDREYRARVPFMVVGALLGGGAGGLVGLQFVVGLGFGLIAFATFGVAVVVFTALVGGTLGAINGLIAYAIAAKVGEIGRRSPHADARPDQLERIGSAPDKPPGEGASPVANAEPQAHLAAELAAFVADLALGQARGELPPPNPESEVPYIQVAAEWLATRTPDDEEPEHTLDAEFPKADWPDVLPAARKPQPNSPEVAWLLRRLEALTPSEWQSLVAAHAEAGRAGPASIDDLSARSASVGVRVFDVMHEASMIGIGAMGEVAADGWREAMRVSSASRLGQVVPSKGIKFSDAERERLYYYAWSYLSPAEWAVGYLVVRATFSAPEWSAFWQPYLSVLGEPPPA